MMPMQTMQRFTSYFIGTDFTHKENKQVTNQLVVKLVLSNSITRKLWFLSET